MLIQAIPVGHFFSEHGEIFYTNIDEDKPGETKVTKEKKEQKENITVHFASLEDEGQLSFFVHRDAARLPSPYVESLIHPPDAVC
jgi:hypothetical protein